MTWLNAFFASLFSVPFLVFTGWGAPTAFAPAPTSSNPWTGSAPIACTMDARLCPDGSYVDRIPPSCEFAACPGATSTNPTSAGPAITTVTPTQGAVGAQVTIDGNGFTGDNTIHFGSGVIMHVAAKRAIYYCPMIPAGSDRTGCGNAAQTVTFTVPKSLDPACAFATPRCEVMSRLTTPGTYTVSVSNANGESNAVSFTVTSGSTTNAVTPIIYSVTPTSGPVGTQVTIDGRGFTANNTIHFDGGVISNVPSTNGPAIMCARFAPNCHPGVQQRLTFTVPSSIAPYCPPGRMCPMYIREVTPGTYGITVQNENGSSNTMQFTVTGGSSGGGSSLSVNGVDAPTTLGVGQTGTWTVHAVASPGTTLHYSVNWGDTVYPMAEAASSASVQASATFTHSYQAAGTYNPVFTVTDDNGHSATVSASVIVGY